MNKKGFTLIELIFSLVLVSIVLIFIMSLLSDLKREDSLNSSRSADLLTRSNIISLIENDIINKGVSSISESNKNGSYINIKIDFNDNTTKNLIVYSNYLVYGAPNKLEKWDFKSIKFLNPSSNKYKYCYKKSDKSSVDGKYYYMLNLNIPVDSDIYAKRKYDFDIMVMGYGIITYSLPSMIHECN